MGGLPVIHACRKSDAMVAVNSAGVSMIKSVAHSLCQSVQ
jgi:hypothetical protein